MMSAEIETRKHIDRVRELLIGVVTDLLERSADHDASKLNPPEADIFDIYTAKLKGCTYGSDEYKGYLQEMKPALDHHYKMNRHHPEHHEDGIGGMSLMDLVEMILDWKAASERHTDGDVLRSIEVNTKRFGIEPQLVKVLINTVYDLGLA